MTWRRNIAAVAVSLAIVLSGGSARATAQGDRGPGGNASGRYGHCVSPSGADINEAWDVDARVLAPFCTEALTGERLATTAVWFMAETFEAVPDGFIPAGDTPLEDFRAKLVGVRYVVDPDTAQERTYVFDDKSRLEPSSGSEGFDVTNTVSMGSIHPLRAGTHVIETYWNFSAEHCDGIDTDRFANCVPAGETLYHRISFEVSPRPSDA